VTGPVRQRPAGIPHPDGEALKVLSVSPIAQDHASLQSLDLPRWTILQADRLARVQMLLEEHDIAVILCECELAAGSWIDVLRHIQPQPNPPSLIVTSRLADDRLWAEALNLGAWDVLSKPFSPSDVIRSVESACEHRRHRGESEKKLRAASR